VCGPYWDLDSVFEIADYLVGCPTIFPT
jgi:hypothetical protein